MLHLLMYLRPDFLILDESWIDALIDSEKNLIGDGNTTPLECFFRSDKIKNFDFNC